MCCSQFLDMANQRQPVYLLEMAIDVPRDPEDAKRFTAGWLALCRERPHVRITVNDCPEIIIEAETEDELRDYVQRLAYLTEHGSDKGG